ncbi:MAG TPA: hypothetical protein VK989_04465, partial [Polyangia bacterium]|nr:hypothetical protein [Polyangia bacterium]
PLHETGSARPAVETSALGVDDANGPNGSGASAGGEHKGQRAVGDRRPTRDRLGLDIGAERPERAK